MEDNNSNSTADSLEVKKDQEARVLLRERFLRLISHLSGHDCNISFYEYTNHTCKVKAFDSAFENIVVENLVTNLPQPIDRAVVRLNDIISLHFEVDLSKIS